ncbi:DnaJ domain-containing protein [Cephalotus follicularis]|uniref:DnaJ domain-containing protein n=1 Tax=Cephalotus follicularis TaxID=3775 RepID=A0A1Q3BRD4_CEPFO|nr:DnaJ domain-containing protein [Cephalotus follicularis]
MTTKSSPTTQTLFHILRIKESASQSEIKAAYRTLAKMHHPDAVSSADSKGLDFIEIHNAYATLSDPIARARYDMSIGATHQFRYSTIFTGFQPASTGFRPMKRWETDQCW